MPPLYIRTFWSFYSIPNHFVYKGALLSILVRAQLPRCHGHTLQYHPGLCIIINRHWGAGTQILEGWWALGFFLASIPVEVGLV